MFSRLLLYSSKGCQKEVSSVAVLTDLKNELNRSKQQEERIRRLDTVWLFKWKEVNRILKEYIFIYGSATFSFFHCHLKSTEWPYASLLKIGLHDCQQLIIVPFFFLEGKACLALEDSKKSLGCMCFFNKVFIWTMYKKAFRLEGYVICFVSAYNAWFPVVIHRVVVILWICL